MKRRTVDFADKLLADPSQDADDVYLDTHQTTNRATARVNASKLLAQPNVMEYMAKKSKVAETTIIQVMQNAKKNKDNVQWQRLAHDSANSILDRVHGKPLTKTNNLNLNISLEDSINSLI